MAKSRIYYFSPAGKIINQAESKQFKQQDYVLSEFENEVFRCELHRLPTVKAESDVPEEFWKFFSVRVQNIIRFDAEDKPLEQPRYVVDPTLTKEFGELESAQGFFKYVIKTNVKDEVEFKDDGAVRGGGNIHEPPDPDKPTVNEANAHLVGIWG